MSVGITRNFGPLTQEARITREDWGRVGRFARERVTINTQSGRDEDGQAFAPYSRDYLSAKLKAGGSSTVNLTVSGAMLQAIRVAPDDQGVTLTIEP